MSCPQQAVDKLWKVWITLWIDKKRAVDNAVTGGEVRMIIRNEQEALQVAVEMERRAIRVYERALTVAGSESARIAVEEILRDEREHLTRFSAMLARLGGEAADEPALIQAMAADALFPGGVMGMAREDALSDLRSVYRYAVDSERRAVEQYGDFARRCEEPAVKNAFLDVAREETIHLASLWERLTALEAEE